MNKNKQPRFSVVIPAYNEAGYIAKSLESLKQQDFTGEFEVIVVDNNSTDTTSAIAKSFNVKVISEKEPGVCFARQAGTNIAKGEIVVSTDADTYFSKDWLTRIDSKFQHNSKIVAITGPCRYMEGPIWATVFPYILFAPFSFIYKITGKTYYASATNIAFKKTAFKGYDTLLTQGGDELELLHDLRREGTVVFDNTNPTFTSARRTARGFIYNFFVTFLIYYLAEYYLNKLFKRRILGRAPQFRNDYSPKILAVLNMTVIIILVSVVLFQRQARNYTVNSTTRIIQKASDIIGKDK